ncbi:MAG: GAF and ANTAR domain-containing protein [Actinomycetota bacterium]|nr:GAF and ANTAR domain-containing protein [Actinomycetota bacterium]
MADSTGEELAEAFGEIARQLQAEQTPHQVLNRIATVAVKLVKGCDHAGISIVRRQGSIDTPVASDDVSPAVDAIQYEVGQGPCLEAIEEHESYLIDDLLTEDRWPAFSRRAAEETGVRSMLSMRLFVEEGTLGALNFYSHQPDAFDEHARAVGAVLAAHAAVAISASRERERVENLEKALESNREIGIAIGILMARGLHTREQAFDVLRRASQQLNIKLRDIASTLADTGELPGRDTLPEANRSAPANG